MQIAGKTRCPKLVVQPRRQRARLQADALQRKVEPRQGSDEGGRLAGGPHLLDDLSRLIDHADRGLFQGDVESGKVRHGCSFLMLWRSDVDHDLTSR